MQEALDAARQRLSDAKADLRHGQASVAHQRRVLAGFAVSNAPVQLTQLSTLGLLFGASSTQQALDRAQAARSALDSQLSSLERLQANQVLLRYTEQRVQRAAKQVAADRAAAAAHLAATQQLESAAAAAEATVEQQVATLRVKRDNLSKARAAELHRIATLKRERDALAAKLRALAARRAAAREAASANPALSADGFLSLPIRISTYVTSPYGMRLHPILHIWELHDGTDFHAPCGTAVYAAAAGRVMSEYYNVGYGNRLILDHGVVDGVSLQTSYNHLSSFVVGVGTQVSRGQLIAYSGNTGWSTACHLHFMVYVNGATVDPMTWL
jgi:murein DD-endopeptidase MepM/ murein hydrolase activator NlpD